MGVQALKFCQNAAAYKALTDTGDSTLLYTQIPAAGEAKNDKLLDDIAAQIFRGSDGSSSFGVLGRPLRKNWGSLLHPEDSFWGVDPILDLRAGRIITCKLSAAVLITFTVLGSSLINKCA